MKCLLSNNKGIALVTSLMLTLISMVVIMALMYMITAGIQRSGAMKRYRTALDASSGGAELVLKDAMPYLMNQFQSYTSSQVINNFQTDYAGFNLVPTTANCLKAKLYTSTANWGACSSSFNVKEQPDITLTLQSTTNMPFNVYAKIVDTVSGNSDTTGSRLDEGGGVAYSGSGITPQHFPYIYRVEVQGERKTNAVEKSNISVLYAY